jgi:NSS family neurotransmitter:Na+ symporter
MIVPAATVFGGGIEKPGPGLMFATLPVVFDKMPGGHIVGAVFFILVLFAALTSSISLMETIVSIFCDKFKWNRKITCGIVFAGCLILGVPSSLGFGLWSGITPLKMDLLSFFDFISNSVMMPIVALLTCFFVGYVIKPVSLIEEMEQGGKFKSKKLFSAIIKYVAPICIVLILISAVLDGLGIVKI